MSIKIGLLGMGTVGGGVVRVMHDNADMITNKICELEIKWIFDKRLDYVNTRLLEWGITGIQTTDNIEDIFNDEDVDIVIEVMGGIHPAAEYLLKAMSLGKSVVTANKDLVASHGQELFKIAAANKVDFLFEASVAGGIPIILPMKESLAANRIQQVMGIVNGTTNFILSKMAATGVDFAECLAEAQELGYAEADPTADVDGYDAARKIAILASIAFNTRVTDSMVYVEGIRNISRWDIEYARELGYVIKLIGYGREVDGEVEARVHPMMIPIKHPLASVDGSFNAVFVEGDAVGKTMFYGRGAGDLPTASAIVGDVMTAARNLLHSSSGAIGCTCYAHKRVRPIEEIESKYFMRVRALDKPRVMARIADELGKNDVSLDAVIQKRAVSKEEAEVVLLTHRVLEKKLRDALHNIAEMDFVSKVESVIRVADDDE